MIAEWESIVEAFQKSFYEKTGVHIDCNPIITDRIVIVMLNSVCTYYNISRAQIVDLDRNMDIARCRQMFTLLCEDYGATTEQWGNILNRDRSGYCKTLQTANKYHGRNSAYRDEYSKVREAFQSKLNELNKQ
jgi:chromosomal replication initiation ATPase DnaA